MLEKMVNNDEERRSTLLIAFSSQAFAVLLRSEGAPLVVPCGRREHEMEAARYPENFGIIVTCVEGGLEEAAEELDRMVGKGPSWGPHMVDAIRWNRDLSDELRNGRGER